MTDPAARGEIEQLKRQFQDFLKPATKPSDPKRDMLYDNLVQHTRIRAVSEKLFKGGFYPQAISEALIALVNMVKEKSGRTDLDGQNLMGQVFGGNTPALRLNPLQTQPDRDEQDGFKLIYMGVYTGIRNPKAHSNIVQNDPLRALKYLCWADLLAQRVEEATKAP